MFTKTNYCNAVQCPKMLWLVTYRPELFDDSAADSAARSTGLVVGALARNLFGRYQEISYLLGKQEKLRETARQIYAGTDVIAEAAFTYRDCYCLADIMHRGADGWELYEVKSSTDVKDMYYEDLAYQYYVITNSGLSITRTYLLLINGAYVRQGDLNLQELFQILDLTEEVRNKSTEVEQNLRGFRAILNQDEPGDCVSPNCFLLNRCGFWGYCIQHLPTPNVFDLSGERNKNKFECYQRGIYSFQQIIDAKPHLTEKSYHQIVCELEQRPLQVNRHAIGGFLGQLYYPLCFLDFETYNPAIPPFDGASPYMQIPSQYSLHIIEREGMVLQHCEFLAVHDTDPRPTLAECLVSDIPDGACILAYNSTFEKGVIHNLANHLPHLAVRLNIIHDSIQDLMIPFRNRDYYSREQHGSYSIKAVLPAMFPDDPELNYHALEGVHNGGEAMNAYSGLGQLSPEERELVRAQLLAYCRLDTLAMVKIWEKLRELIYN